MPRSLPPPLPLLFLLCCAAAPAQTVHKCTLDGKVSYTELPCQAGTASVIAVPDAPARDQAAAAELSRMKKQADALAKERRQREAAGAREDAIANRAAAARRQKCEKVKLDQKWADDDLRRAQPQQQEGARIKAQRAADKVRLACSS